MDARKPPGALEALRDGNRARLVDALRRAGTASRADLARATGLSRSTVSSLVADLQERGVVTERGDDRSRAGRPGVLLALDPSAGAAVGVDFGHSHLRVAVADLSSTVLAERLEALDVDHRADEALDRAADLVGAGLLLGGRLHHGATGVAGELGHVQVRADGAVCRCGNRGCLETMAAAGPLLESMRAAHGPLTVRAMLELAGAGDLGARRVLED